MPKKQKNPPPDLKAPLSMVRCERLSKSSSGINIYLTNDQAIQLARDLLIRVNVKQGEHDDGLRIWNAKGNHLRVTSYKLPKKGKHREHE